MTNINGLQKPRGYRLSVTLDEETTERFQRIEVAEGREPLGAMGYFLRPLLHELLKSYEREVLDGTMRLRQFEEAVGMIGLADRSGRPARHGNRGLLRPVPPAES